MSTSIRLRTLALASVMNFGRHYDMTVQQIIDLMKVDGFRYLTWVYYNCSNISFNAQILETLGIYGENTIQKPGKVSKDEYIQFSMKVVGIRIERENIDMTAEEITIRNNNSMILRTNLKRGKIKGQNVHRNRFVNKGHLQALNRGNVNY